MTDAGALWLHEASVRPDWVDYNGHMSEAYYVLIFGDATDAFYDHVGLDQREREAQRVSVYTVEAHIRYLTEAHEGSALRIATRVMSHDAKRLRLRHEMVRAADGVTLAITELLLLHVDKVALRASPFAPYVAARIADIARAHAVLPAEEPVVSRHWQGA
jgi:acyl-CoA thioester hydrolase